jgi:hypothetical protein
MRPKRIAALGPVVRQGPYLRRTDGTELIDCSGIVDETHLPFAVIKSEIEHKYLAGRRFYRHPDCSLIERTAYETWKRERLPHVAHHIRHEGGLAMFDAASGRSLARPASESEDSLALENRATDARFSVKGARDAVRTFFEEEPPPSDW